MIKPKLALFAEQMIFDRDSGSPTAINILAGLIAPQFPFIMPRLACYFLLERELTDPQIAELTFRLLCVGKEILNIPISANFLDTTVSSSSLILNGVVVPSPGKVSCQLIKQDKSILIEYSFEVVAQSSPTATNLQAAPPMVAAAEPVKAPTETPVTT